VYKSLDSSIILAMVMAMSLCEIAFSDGTVVYEYLVNLGAVALSNIVLMHDKPFKVSDIEREFYDTYCFPWQEDHWIALFFLKEDGYEDKEEYVVEAESFAVIPAYDELVDVPTDSQVCDSFRSFFGKMPFEYKLALPDPFNMSDLSEL